MQGRGNRAGTARSQGGKDRRNIIEYSVAVQAKGREGSGRILGDGGSHGRGSSVHRLGRPKWGLGHEWFIRGRSLMGSGHAGQEVGVMGVRTETIGWK